MDCSNYGEITEISEFSEIRERVFRLFHLFRRNKCVILRRPLARSGEIPWIRRASPGGVPAMFARQARVPGACGIADGEGGSPTRPPFPRNRRAYRKGDMVETYEKRLSIYRRPSIH